MDFLTAKHINRTNTHALLQYFIITVKRRIAALLELCSISKDLWRCCSNSGTNNHWYPFNTILTMKGKQYMNISSVDRLRIWKNKVEFLSILMLKYSFWTQNKRHYLWRDCTCQNDHRMKTTQARNAMVAGTAGRSPTVGRDTNCSQGLLNTKETWLSLGFRGDTVGQQ